MHGEGGGRLAEAMHWWASGPIGIFIAIFGLVGNILSIIVWTKIRRRRGASPKTKNTGMYLIVLSVVDSSLLVCFLFQDSLKAMAPDIVKSYSFAIYYSYFAFPMIFYLVFASIWLVVLVTIDRYLLIRHNFEGNNKITFTSIFVLLFVGFLFNIPHFFNYKPDLVVDEEDGSQYYTFVATEYGKSEVCQRYEFWLHCMFIVLAPLAAIGFLNFMIIRCIFETSVRAFAKIEVKYDKQSDTFKMNSNAVKSDFKKDQLQKRMEQDSQITTLLLSVTFTFLILISWQCITQCFWMTGYGKDSEDPSVWDRVDEAFALAKLGVVINSSINSILYCFTGSLFRNELIRLLKRN